MQTADRRRMGTEDRREQLLDAGVELLRHCPHEAVSTEDIAEAAGVSKGLLYHYFPTKKAFILAALERGQAELVERLRPDSALEPIARLDASLDGFLDSVEDHAASYAAIFRRGGGDPDISTVLNAGREQQLEILLAALASIEGTPVGVRRTPALEAAMQGWLFFCEGAVLRWLEHGGLERERLRLLLRTALVGALGAAAAADGKAP